MEHRDADANRLGVAQRLWPQLLGGAILTLLLLRPLTLMGLDDGVARNWGWRCLWRASAP